MSESYLIKAEVDAPSTNKIRDGIEQMKTVSRSGIEFRNDFHCTLLFAKSWNRNRTVQTDGIFQKYQKLQVSARINSIDQFGSAIVLRLTDCPHLYQRNMHFLAFLEAVPDFSIYNPHITIGYKQIPLTENEKTFLEVVFKDIDIFFSHENGKLFIKR